MKTVGYNWPVDERHKKFHQEKIGGYTVIQNFNEGVIVSGGREVNLFNENIGPVSIDFFEIGTLTEHYPSVLEDGEIHQTIHSVYKFEIGKIYFTVSFSGYQWVFSSLDEANQMASVIFSTKFTGFVDYIKEKYE